jgi:hypothetical protein
VPPGVTSPVSVAPVDVMSVGAPVTTEGRCCAWATAGTSAIVTQATTAARAPILGHQDGLNHPVMRRG